MFAQSSVKNTEWSIWLENFQFEYLKGAHFKFGFFLAHFECKESFGGISVKITKWSIW